MIFVRVPKMWERIGDEGGGGQFVGKATRRTTKMDKKLRNKEDIY
jgi:hypothetical protein